MVANMANLNWNTLNPSDFMASKNVQVFFPDKSLPAATLATETRSTE